MVIVIVTLTLFLDRLSKILITQALAVGQTSPIIKNIFHFTLVHNKGAAFGILKDQVPFFIFTGFLATILITYNLRGNQGKAYTISLSLILAGALGNLIDRIFFGYVIDFLDFRIWPVFNLADSAITIGAVLLGWKIITSRKTTNS